MDDDSLDGSTSGASAPLVETVTDDTSINDLPSDVHASPTPPIEFINHELVHAPDDIDNLFQQTGLVETVLDDDSLDDNYGFATYHHPPSSLPSHDTDDSAFRFLSII